MRHLPHVAHAMHSLWCDVPRGGDSCRDSLFGVPIHVTLAPLEHQFDPLLILQDRYIAHGIAIYYDEIRQLAWCDSPYIVCPSQTFRSPSGACLECLHGRQARLDQIVPFSGIDSVLVASGIRTRDDLDACRQSTLRS